MRLHIRNLLDPRQSDLELEDRQYVIGRGADNDIVLDSFFVAMRQCLLKCKGGKAALMPVGSIDVKVNGKVIPNDTTRLLVNGDEIEISHFLLTLYCDTTETDRRKESVVSRMHELETRLHQALLERLDLRKLKPESLAAQVYRAQVEEALNAILEDELPPDPELMEFATRESLRNFIALLHANLVDSREEKPSAGDGAMRQFGELARQMHKRALEALGAGTGRVAEIEEVENWIDTNFDEFRYALMAGIKSGLLHAYFKSNILNTVFGFGPLEDLLKLPNISEIMVVHPSLIYIEKNGVIQKTSRQFVSEEVALSIIERIISPLGLRVDRSKPYEDARLPDGSRVNIIIPPLARRGPCITIRKFAKIPLTMEKLVREKKALAEQAAEFLRCCIQCRKNVIISGGTGAGKTTLLNCLSEFISHRERIVTIEDSAELQLQQEHVITLEARPANMQGKGAVTIRDLVRNALRMRPDRIIVGECRGGEALDMLQAMNTGHDGSMTTGHANSPEDMLRRIETMVLTCTDMPIAAIREQIVSAIDLIVQYTRFADGRRKVTRISEVVKINRDTGAIILEDIFDYRYQADQPEGRLRHTGYIPTFINALLTRGALTLDLLFQEG